MRQSIYVNESKARLKRGTPFCSKDKIPRKRKGANEKDGHNMEVVAQEASQDIKIDNTSKEVQVHENDENKEISINYVLTGKRWNRNNVDINNIFAYNVAIEVMQDEDLELKSVGEYRQRNNWTKWKDAIQAELASFEKREVFGPIFRTPEGVKPIGYKRVFMRKRNEKNEVARYKARLVAQGFSQRHGIDYMETYSPVVDAITFRYLISLVVREKLDMRLMDVVTAYLYGSLDNEIFMKIPK